MSIDAPSPRAATLAAETYRGLLESAPDAIFGVDPTGVIVFANTQASRLFGYSLEELTGQPVDMLVPDASKRVHAGHRARYVHDPAPRPMGAGMQLAGRRRDGTEFPAEISLSALRTDEGLLVSVAIRDVTERLEVQAERERLRSEAERRELEQQLHQAQRLESLGQLAGGVAHDFNNLLGVILIYTSLVAEEVAKEAAATNDARWTSVASDVSRISEAAERASQLTHQLLAFARREVVRPQVVNLNDVVRGIDQILRRTLGEHIELGITLPEGIWPVVADPGQIDQVLVNLAVNARDAMPGGGRLTIDTENIVADEVYASAHPVVSAGRYVRLRVSDSGQGMDAATRERAFEPFFTTKPKGEGSGLGLATVYGIITQAGGSAQLYSEPGIGTTFTALLPASEQSGATAAPAPSPRAERAVGETILVVEDEEALREVTCRILKRSGYTVKDAANGAEALQVADALPKPIDLLLTDVVMPGMLGKELAERMTATYPQARVLYMSGYAHPVLTSHDTLAEGVALVEKPFSEQQLLARVREVLDSAT